MTCKNIYGGKNYEIITNYSEVFSIESSGLLTAVFP